MVRQALDALLAALLTAVVAPAVITGSAEMIAAAHTLLAALRLPMIVAALVGMGSVAILMKDLRRAIRGQRTAIRGKRTR